MNIYYTMIRLEISALGSKNFFFQLLSAQYLLVYKVFTALLKGKAVYKMSLLYVWHPKCSCNLPLKEDKNSIRMLHYFLEVSTHPHDRDKIRFRLLFETLNTNYCKLFHISNNSMWIKCMYVHVQYKIKTHNIIVVVRLHRFYW